MKYYHFHDNHWHMIKHIEWWQYTYVNQSYHSLLSTLIDKVCTKSKIGIRPFICYSYIVYANYLICIITNIH